MDKRKSAPTYLKSEGENPDKKKFLGKKRSQTKNNRDGDSSARKVIVKPTGNKWFEEECAVKKKIAEGAPKHQTYQKSFLQLKKEEILEIQKKASALLDGDVEAYKTVNSSGQSKNDFKWMEKMMKTGTLPDKMAAFIVRIQDSPVHNLYYLQQLISMVKVQGKQQCLMTADTLRDLFVEDLLPPNCKLKNFGTRGVELKTATDKELIKWAFEDRLKEAYGNFIEALRRMASDTVEKLRGKGISIIYQLLVNHPEGEETLLQILVNKLGDPVKKMASRALFYLKQLLNEHPRMKRVVVEEVERLIFRNNISKRAQYYGICFLNLIDLKDEHASLAHKLITVYIAFFKSCVKTGDIDTKMMSGLLTGINKAFPLSKEFGFQFTEHLDTLYKIVQFSQFGISIQALCILFQVVDVEKNSAGADRFYRVLYEKLNDPEFKTSAHNTQFLNLVFKAMKSDTDVNRVASFTKKLLQICQNSSPNLACAILLLISEISGTHPQCVKVGNLSSAQSQLSSDNQKAVNLEMSKIKDGVAKLSNDLQSKALEKLMKSSNVVANTFGSCVFETKPFRNKTMLTPVITQDPKKEENSEDKKPELKKLIKVLTAYDPYARNPSFSGAELSLSFELLSLSQHFHPSVALFAQTLIEKKSIRYDGNPFRDFTLTRFLERFSYRNVKSKARPEYQPKGLRNVPVNSEDYLSTEEKDIPIEEKFFFRFFKTRKNAVSAGKEKDEDLSDTESVGDDEFDALMENYFKSSKGDDDDGGELTMEENNSVDFASGVSRATGKGKGKKRRLEESSEEDEEDQENDEDDDADSFEEEGDEFISLDGTDDFEDMDSDEEVCVFEQDEASFVNEKRRKSKKSEDMFAPADAFAEMLEENADDIMTGSHTLINREKADKKQLRWEMSRDNWMKGYGRGRTKNNTKKRIKKS